ncbi:MAG: hypothetical protein H6622_14065 [Halobacteriovoraceae bacterium]|nr:hypothetical protein [Halobacteriovoraceae bacterium]
MNDQIKNLENLQGKRDEFGPISNILFSFVIPVTILNKLTPYLNPYFGKNSSLITLFIALSIPVGFGLLEYIKFRKKNFITIMGIVNTLMTGGFAAYQLSGIWFAIKEAAFPLMFGVFFLSSAFYGRPLIEIMLYNEKVMDVRRINQILLDNGNQQYFISHLRKSTIFLSFSFFLSAILNFALASYIFTELPIGLSAHEKGIILNEQISDMMWKSYIVIMLPCMVVTLFIIKYLADGIKKYTNLSFNEVIVGMKEQS